MLTADSKLANIDGSVRQYIVDQLTTTFPAGSIDFGFGQPFSDETLAEWLQVRMLEPARSEFRWGPRASPEDDRRYAREIFHLLNANIFVRPAKLATLNLLRLQTLRDTVLNVLTPRTTIPVKDHASDGDTIGNLVVDEILQDRHVPSLAAEVELVQWNLVLRMRWTETWTEA